MRVPPSKPDNLTKNGDSIRVWKDSHSKLRTLASLRNQQQAVVFDALVHDALQAAYDEMEGADE